ncbi:MAG: HupE/UreJ family protein [Calditrichaeota bacterium]|nr:MAG: HupE/UreJ family protein [Calditrichota bacterium]
MRRILPQIAIASLLFLTLVAFLPDGEAGGKLQAHPSYTVYLILRFQGDTLHLHARLRAFDLATELNWDPHPYTGQYDRGILSNRREEILEYFRERMEVRINYLIEPEWEAMEVSFPEPQPGNLLVDAHFQATGLPDPEVVNIRVDFRNHLYPGGVFDCLGSVRHRGRLRQFTLDDGEPYARIMLREDGPSGFLTFRSFLEMGVRHIFLGIDHIMFLLGLIIIGGRLMEMVKVVTAFTVAHSITLSLAALNLVNFSPVIVESAIALSIVYVAAENFFIATLDKRWMLTGFFGLAHGFGFANVLRELGLPQQNMLLSLFSFNLGVEVGQILIVTLCLPIIWGVAKSRWRRPIVYGCSAIIFVLGFTWFLERAFSLPVGLL